MKFVTTDGIETISLFNDVLNRALHSLLSNEKTMDIVFMNMTRKQKDVKLRAEHVGCQHY